MTISCDIAGEGPAVVLLHAGVCDRRMWDAQFSAIVAAGHRVLRCDFRGYGETPVAEAPYTDTGDVLDLMDAHGVERAALVGASWGGRVALLAAARAPHRVTGLALLDSVLPGLPGEDGKSPELAAFDEAEDAFFEAGDLDGATELNVRTWLGPEAGPEARAAVRRMQRHAFAVQSAAEEAVERDGAAYVLDQDEEVWPPDLGGLREVPVLAVTGADDLPDFRGPAAALSALLPRARHVELPGTGHLPALERPAETTALLTGFLAGLPA